MTIPYEKPFLSIEQQVSLLEERGMNVGDRAEAAEWLRRVGYYRLSGYWYPLRRSERRDDGRRQILDEFVAGTALTDVVAIYEFDRKLRLLVMDAIERVEVAIRFHVGHVLGRRSAFAHTDPAHLSIEFAGGRADVPPALDRWAQSDHAAWLAIRRRESQRSKADFVKHFKTKYGEPLPVWVITEILDFGGLVYLYGGMLQRDRDEIAAELGLLDSAGAGHSGALKDWLQNLNYVRNLCAHHARFWNANVVARVSPKNIAPIARLAHITGGRTTERPYASLAILALLTTTINAEDDWPSRLRALIDQIPSNRAAAEMGFPDGWNTLGIWS